MEDNAEDEVDNEVQMCNEEALSKQNHLNANPSSTKSKSSSGNIESSKTQTPKPNNKNTVQKSLCPA